MTQIALINTDLICENQPNSCYLHSIKNVTVMYTSIYQMSQLVIYITQENLIVLKQVPAELNFNSFCGFEALRDKKGFCQDAKPQVKLLTILLLFL